MTASQRQHGGSTAGTSTHVEIRVAADATQLPLLRSVAAHIALRADFDLDAVEDAKLTVDELCSTLIGHAADGSTLSCVFRSSDNAITICGEVTASTAESVDQRSFGWHVLSTLATSVHTTTAPNDAVSGSHLLAIEATMRRGRAPAR
ncbi:MAG: hypothetical protein J2O49_03540 [Sciscionella sp.]|nr:hypothetical protein [Sciscionella sp.]